MSTKFIASNKAPAFRTIAWNGISFQAPSNWEAGRVGRYYLLLEDEYGPAMEIKWAPARPHFSLQKHLRRLSTQHRQSAKIVIQEHPIADTWQKALSGRQSLGFSWKQQDKSGKGVITFCPTCQTAALIQFYDNDAATDGRSAAHILSSYCDHVPKGRALWSLFDVSFRISDSYTLAKYQFEAGRLSISFTQKGHQLNFYRWSAAAAALGAKSLFDLAPVLFPNYQGNWHSKHSNEQQGAVCETNLAQQPNNSGWRRFFTRKSSSKWIRLWHLKHCNRLLAVTVQGRSLPSRSLLSEICSSYEIIY